jgi:CDP-glycerol:poly(glycerophosphate) glycerophosphotransferase
MLRGAPTQPVDLVHDTFLRRSRHAAASALHRLDAALSSIGRTRCRVLFEAASPLSFAVFRPVYERLARDPRIDFWFTASSHTWPAKALFASVGITDHVVSASAAAWMKVDAYINADFWDTTWLYRRTTRIHMFHGVAGKYGLDSPVDIAPTVRAFDCLMFPNADRLARYVAAGLVADHPRAAPLVGYPKVDCLVDGSLDAASVASGLGLDRRAPIAIYAPTWSPHSTLNAMGEDIIDALAAEGLQVIVKLHDRSYDLSRRASGGIDWSARLRRFDAHPRVRVVRDADACPYLFIADALVTGHSSIGFEYLLLDRPVVVVESPDFAKKARINPEKVEWLRSAATLAANPSEAARAVVRELTTPSPLGAARRRVAANVFHQPGSAAARAATLVYDILNLPAPAAAPDNELQSGALYASAGQRT